LTRDRLDLSHDRRCAESLDLSTYCRSILCTYLLHAAVRCPVYALHPLILVPVASLPSAGIPLVFRVIVYRVSRCLIASLGLAAIWILRVDSSSSSSGCIRRRANAAFTQGGPHLLCPGTTRLDIFDCAALRAARRGMGCGGAAETRAAPPATPFSQTSLGQFVPFGGRTRANSCLE
jgi:hypothetical protein